MVVNELKEWQVGHLQPINDLGELAVSVSAPLNVCFRTAVDANKLKVMQCQNAELAPLKIGFPAPIAFLGADLMFEVLLLS